MGTVVSFPNVRYVTLDQLCVRDRERAGTRGGNYKQGDTDLDRLGSVTGDRPLNFWA